MFFKHLGVRGEVIALWMESAHDPKYCFFVFSTFFNRHYLGPSAPYWAMCFTSPVPTQFLGLLAQALSLQIGFLSQSAWNHTGCPPSIYVSIWKLSLVLKFRLRLAKRVDYHSKVEKKNPCMVVRRLSAARGKFIGSYNEDFKSYQLQVWLDLEAHTMPL